MADIDFLARSIALVLFQRVLERDRGLFEYEDYQAAPTRGNASEFITRAIEDNYESVAKRENYVDYIAMVGGGLFTAAFDVRALENDARRRQHLPRFC